MTDDKQLVIEHHPTGRPVVEGWNIAISHTRGFAAIILSKVKNVAIDIEYQSNRVDRIAEKFIRPDEQASTTLTRLIIWCAKETMYKYFYEEGLQYFDMRVNPDLETSHQPLLQDNVYKSAICDLKTSVPLDFYYQITPAYVLTWAMGE